MPAKAYFDNIEEEIVKRLNAAVHSIHIAIAWFTNPTLFGILCNKAKSGVLVSVIISNDEINKKCGIAYDMLLKSGGQIHIVGNGTELMHNKFCVIDNLTVITGSYNWTYYAQLNDENITVINNDVGLATEFIAAFYSLYSKYISSDPLTSSTFQLINKILAEAELDLVRAKARKELTALEM